MVLEKLIYIVETLIFIRAILSFIVRDTGNAITSFIFQVTEPILSPFRELLRRLKIDTGMIDFRLFWLYYFCPFCLELLIQLFGRINMTIDKNALIEHIKDKTQHLNMRRVLDKLERVIEKYTIEYTDFLDPYQRKLCYSFINRFQEISFFEDGGLENSERKSIIMFPSYMTRSDVVSPIQALRVDGSFKFRELTHRDYLGAIMSLGIKREKIGDILIHKDYGNIITFKEIADYIRYNLDIINREPVAISEVESFELIEVEDDFVRKA